MKKPFKEKPKMYRVTKYIKANNALSAIRKDKTTPVHDVWVDNDWKPDHLAYAIGFAETDKDPDYEEE